MNNDFTTNDIVGTVRTLADKNPETVIGKVEYTDPGCIIGQALLILGVPNEKLVELKNDPPNIAVQKLTTHEDGDIAKSNRLNWLWHVGNAQDFGKTWAESVAFADSI